MLTVLLSTVLVAGETPPVSDILAAFRARYPEFDAVADATVQAHLDDAARDVDGTWFEADRQRGQMLLAAHTLSAAGLGANGETSALTAAGVSQVRSGTLSLSFRDGGVAGSSGAHGGTQYGRDFDMLALKNRGGPRTTTPVAGAYGQFGWPSSLFVANGILG